MARSPEKIKERNEKIAVYFNVLCSKTTAKGKMKYSYDYVLEKVADKFYLETRTIENILKGK